MKQSTLSKDLFFVSVLTVITVITWITLETYRTLTKKDVPPILKEQLEPLNPEIDTSVLGGLSQKINPDQKELILVVSSPTTTSSEIKIQ